MEDITEHDIISISGNQEPPLIHERIGQLGRSFEIPQDAHQRFVCSTLYLVYPPYQSSRNVAFHRDHPQNL